MLSKDTLNSIPTAGTYNALVVLVPGLFGGQQDVSMGPCNSCTFSAHGAILSGGRANSEARLLLDGLSIAVPQAGGTNYLTDTRNAQEVSFTTQGSTARGRIGRPGDEHRPAQRRQQHVGQRVTGAGPTAHCRAATTPTS